MSMCLPKDVDFIRACKNIAEKYDCSCSWDGSVECYYDASFSNHRDYVIRFTTNQTSVPIALKQKLKEIGAVKIIGRVRKAIVRNYVDIAFDKKVKEVNFINWSECIEFFKISVFTPFSSQYAVESALYNWFKSKIKIIIADKEVSYREVIMTIIPKCSNDVLCKSIIEKENENDQQRTFN